MDITLLNFAEVGRRQKISKQYAFLLFTGARRYEPRLRSIAKLLDMSYEDLKSQIDAIAHRRRRAHKSKANQSIKQ